MTCGPTGTKVTKKEKKTSIRRVRFHYILSHCLITFYGTLAPVTVFPIIQFLGDNRRGGQVERGGSPVADKHAAAAGEHCQPWLPQCESS